MNKKLTKSIFLAFAVAVGANTAMADVSINMNTSSVLKKGAEEVPHATMVINGTGSTEVIKVNASNLPGNITLRATAGLDVYPTTIKAGTAEAKVYVTLKSTLPETQGRVILRSGDVRAYVNVTGYGTELEQKDLTQSLVFKGTDSDFLKGEPDGFTPGTDGYTVEFRVKNEDPASIIDAFAVTRKGGSFKAYVAANGMGFYNGSTQVGIENPATDASGGKKQFYNNDGLFHTYRYAVTSDQRVFVYRDGQLVARLRTGDYGHQKDWSVADGELTENLLKNPGFEGEFNFRSSDSLLNRVEGWYVDPIDKYNCEYSVPTHEINNELDADNHVMKLQRYNWNDGWGAGTVSQIVDVAPNSTYSLTCLAGGGMNLKTGEIMSSIRLEEVQNSKLGTKVNVTNENGMETYNLTYTTSADCNQLKVILYNERFLNGGGWGSNPKAFLVDEMQLTGMSRVLDQKVGFDNKRAYLEYFTYDVTGAYAPLAPVLKPEVDELYLEGTGSEKTVKVKIANIVCDDPVTVTATPGIKVYPTKLTANADGEVTIKLLSTLPETTGKVIFRCGDMRAYIDVYGEGSALERKDLSENPVFVPDGSKTYSAGIPDGFTPSVENGYTVEFKVKTTNDNQSIDVFGVTRDGASFQTYVDGTGMGIYNRNSQIAFSNPATATSGGKQVFYNNDGNYHTYRYAVTPDQRIFVYRDGLLVGNVRAADYAHQPEWLVDEGEISENLLKNADFEGEWNKRESDDLVNRVEGWILDPIDQYNCNYSVPKHEINKDYDHNNHVMKLQRYNWNDGWGAGTVSQYVDVAPNSTYSLTFLAGGGMNTKTGEIMSSVRVEEAQNSKLGDKVDITNVDGMETYSINYTTSAECNQIKVILYNERFLNGGGWGSSPKEFLVDNMQLVGKSRVLDQKVGYSTTNSRLDLVYFTYDVTGAYAPLEPSFGDNFTGINGIAADPNSVVRALVEDHALRLVNVDADASVTVYNSLGQVVATLAKYDGSAIPLPAAGVYVCVIENNGAKRTIKVVY